MQNYLDRNPAIGNTKIVIFNPRSKQEIRRIPLGRTYSADFQPSLDGTKIYLVKRETGEIFCLNPATETVTFFAATCLPDFDGWCRATLVAAN